MEDGKNLFISIEKYACFYVQIKMAVAIQGWSLMWSSCGINRFIFVCVRAKAPSPSQDLYPGCSWTTAVCFIESKSFHLLGHLLVSCHRHSLTSMETHADKEVEVKI